MRQLHYRTMIDRGRKAGLQTVDLYRALAGRSGGPDGRDGGQADQNGFVAAFNAAGRLEYRPAGRDRQ